MIPRAWRCSGTRSRVLVKRRVDVGPEPLELHRRRTGKASDRGFRSNELPLPERHQLAYGHSVAGDDEGLSAIEGSHDLAALVAELPLSDLAWHSRIVALVLREAGGLYALETGRTGSLGGEEGQRYPLRLPQPAPRHALPTRKPASGSP